MLYLPASWKIQLAIDSFFINEPSKLGNAGIGSRAWSGRRSFEDEASGSAARTIGENLRFEHENSSAKLRKMIGRGGASKSGPDDDYIRVRKCRGRRLKLQAFV